VRNKAESSPASSPRTAPTWSLTRFETVPELPEIEVLARHLQPLLRGKTIRGVDARRAKVLRPDSPRKFQCAVLGATFTGLSRRGKYLLFQLQPPNGGKPFIVLGHLGMTGRMYLAERDGHLPKHAAVVFDLGAKNFIYEDPRYFGRLTLDSSAVARLGPEPLSDDFEPAQFRGALKRSRQAIKVKLLDQTLVAGIGNIYASEALFQARVSPRLAANRLTLAPARRLWRAIRDVLTEAIACGSTVPLNFGADKTDFYEERLRVYDRAGKPCPRCRRPIRRITQAARSTFYCPHCQGRA
jgi:formamidopyrimidine-DNA glycosylase